MTHRAKQQTQASSKLTWRRETGQIDHVEGTALVSSLQPVCSRPGERPALMNLSDSPVILPTILRGINVSYSASLFCLNVLHHLNYPALKVLDTSCHLV